MAFKAESEGTERAFADLELRTLSLEDEVARRTRVERRMLALLELTGELAAARTREEIFALALDKGMKAVGAAAIAMFRRDGEELELLAASSLFEPHISLYHRVPLDAELPICDVVRTGEPRFIGSRDAFRIRYPNTFESVVGTLPFAEFAFATLPLTLGSPFGAIAFTYDHRRVFEPADQAFKAMVARQCAIALERVAANEHERALRIESELLYQLTAQVNQVEGIDEVCELALQAVERGAHCERSAILLFDNDRKMRFRAHHGLSDAYRAAVDGHSPWTWSTRDAVPIAVADVASDPAWEGFRDVFRREAIRALAFVPLVHHGKLVGKLMLYRNEPRPFEARDLQLASTVAVHVAHAVERTNDERALARAFSEERAARLEADEATRAREEILSVVSHDLRNPLGTILIGASTLLQADVGDRGRVRNVAGRIHRQAERMARLIDDLVDFAAIQSGRIALTRAAHPPAEILDAAAEMFGAIAAERGIAFETRAATELPSVECDAERAVQVLSNLIANAVKVTPRGGAIAIGAQPHADAIVFFVRDTGPGIEPGDLPRLFERFWRSKSSPYKGTGLGLSIARGIVDAHGGRIWAESELGKGSAFYFQL